MKYEKILGGLIGAAAGDAMGAASEARTRKQILAAFGGPVTDLVKPPMDTFGAGNEAGGYTDDFSSAFFVAEEIVKNKGTVDKAGVQRALVEWSKHAEFFDRFAGPTTRAAIKRFEGEDVSQMTNSKNPSRAATNGSAMRIAPIGLIDAGNMEKAIKDAILVTEVTHDNTLALSGACAVAAAVCCAMEDDADIYDVFRAGIYGAKCGEAEGLRRGSYIAGPSVVKRIEMAAEIGFGPGSVEEKAEDIADIIGTGLHISEAVPAAFGFAAACGGDAMPSLIAAVNAGYDTDTVATMVGGITGTLSGAEAFPAHFCPQMEQVNGLDITALAQGIDALHR